jgi:hypothetical protein
MSAKRRPYGLLPPAAALAVVGLFVLLYLVDRSDYYAYLTGYGITPFRYPFLDGEYVLNATRCWAEGENVYARNPCDITGRLFDYSPIWLRVGILAHDRIRVDLFGLVLAIGFSLSLFCLPRPARTRDAVLIALATISTMTIFALERANLDLMMFLAAVLAAVLLTRSRPARMVGYGAILGAGLLKFYPLVLLVLSVVERPRWFALVAGTAWIAIAAFVWWFLPELREMGLNLPSSAYFFDQFGAANLPYGLAVIAGMDPADRRSPALLLLALLLAGLVHHMVRLSMRDEVRTSVENLTKPEAMFLAVGAALLCGCFISGQNIGYRGIFFLLVLPGILALARDGTTPWMRARCAATGAMILFLMWNEAIRHLLTNGLAALDVPTAAGVVLKLMVWGLREVIWWHVIATLGGLLLCFLAQTETAEYARLLLRRPMRS